MLWCNVSRKLIRFHSLIQLEQQSIIYTLGLIISTCTRKYKLSPSKSIIKIASLISLTSKIIFSIANKWNSNGESIKLASKSWGRLVFIRIRKYSKCRPLVTIDVESGETSELDWTSKLFLKKLILILIYLKSKILK